MRTADLLPNDRTAQLDAGRALLATGKFEERARGRKGSCKATPKTSTHILRRQASAALKDFDSALSIFRRR